MNNQRANAEAELNAVKTIHTTDPKVVLHSMKQFISENFPAGELPDLVLTGEDGDERLNPYYESIESGFPESIPVARFKDLCGEYCTASSFAVWLSIQILQGVYTAGFSHQKESAPETRSANPDL